MTALEGVDLAVRPGTMHAVVGENGAGKTTLMRILYGALAPTEGTVEIEGRPLAPGSSAALAAGIGMVAQHAGVVPDLTNLENLLLGTPGPFLLDRRAAIARADELARGMGFAFDWDRPSREMGPAGAQRLEILKLLWRGARIMILDEPTAMLSPQDGEALFASLDRLVAEGKTVLLVTHRLPEVFGHCERATVLRAGRLVGDVAVGETTQDDLARMIVGGGDLPDSAHDAPDPGRVRLSVRAAADGPRLKGASLDLRAGEVVGLAGVDGSGQRELFRAIAGVGPLAHGEVEFDGARLRSAADRIAMGLRTIPEDRHEEGVVEDWSLEENSALGLQRTPALARGARIRRIERSGWAARVAERFRTRHGGLNLPMTSLSGGNQQRFVAARALESDPNVIVAFQPARGLDLAATAEIYGAIRARARAGAAALVIGFDLDELLEQCDRVLVMHDGRVFEPRPEQARDRNAIGRLMTGAA